MKQPKNNVKSQMSYKNKQQKIVGDPKYVLLIKILEYTYKILCVVLGGGYAINHLLK